MKEKKKEERNLEALTKIFRIEIPRLDSGFLFSSLLCHSNACSDPSHALSLCRTFEFLATSLLPHHLSNVVKGLRSPAPPLFLALFPPLSKLKKKEEKKVRGTPVRGTHSVKSFYYGEF
jgi:hypothetical protein